MHRRASLARLWISYALISGCSNSVPATPAGVVKYKGRPVSNVHVAFHHPGTKDPIASGTSDSTGSVELFTVRGEPTTLEPGKYQVTVQNTGEPTWSFPSKYQHPSRTPLLVEVVREHPIEILIP